MPFLCLNPMCNFQVLIQSIVYHMRNDRPSKVIFFFSPTRPTWLLLYRLFKWGHMSPLNLMWVINTFIPSIVYKWVCITVTTKYENKCPWIFEIVKQSKSTLLCVSHKAAFCSHRSLKNHCYHICSFVNFIGVVAKICHGINNTVDIDRWSLHRT